MEPALRPIPVGNAWDGLISPLFGTPSGQRLLQRLDIERKTKKIYPPEARQFAALALTPPEETRVVILGQDPYYRAGQAHGLALSVPRGVKIPPSLRNVFSELESDLGIPPAGHGDLTGWAKQGVLLLNAVLTVEEGKPNAHAGCGWEEITDAVVAYLAASGRPVAFCLWGRQAQAKEKSIARPGLLILKAPHPSPLSAYQGFFGSKPFSKINAHLQRHGQPSIDWQLE